MTIQEIEIYLKKHFFLVFSYHSEYYSLKRHRSLFCPQYSFISTDGPSQQRNSLKKLCEQAYTKDGTLLIEAIKCIEIPEWRDSSWETYEAVRHIAVVYGVEIHFLYKRTGYWITHAGDGRSVLSDDSGFSQTFDSCLDLFRYALIDGFPLESIWEKVVVDSC